MVALFMGGCQLFCFSLLVTFDCFVLNRSSGVCWPGFLYDFFFRPFQFKELDARLWVGFGSLGDGMFVSWL